MDETPPERPKAQRLSLTKKQLEEAVAVDLLQLLQTITADGRLLHDEVTVLSAWLRDRQKERLPAIAHLTGVVERVLQDGKVTDEERAFVQQEVERILPAAARAEATMRRREARADDKRLAAEEQRRRAPLADFDFMVAGVGFDNRQPTIEHVRADDRVYLAREPQNAYSPNAILVLRADGADLGYVPEEEAKRLAPILDGGAHQDATVKRTLSGYRGRIPVIWGGLYRPDADAPDAVPPQRVPAHVARRKVAPFASASPAQTPQILSIARQQRKSTSWFVWIVVAAVVLAVLALVMTAAGQSPPPTPTPAPSPTATAAPAPRAATIYGNRPPWQMDGAQLGMKPTPVPSPTPASGLAGAAATVKLRPTRISNLDPETRTETPQPGGPLPDYIKDVVAYREGDGFVVYLVLADSAGREIAADGTVSITVHAANYQHDEQGFWDSKKVNATDFRASLVGIGAFERGRVLARLPLPTLSARLGHHAVSFTLDTYTHELPGDDVEAAIPRAELLDRGRSAN
jgi:hypothetical protein